MQPGRSKPLRAWELTRRQPHQSVNKKLLCTLIAATAEAMVTTLVCACNYSEFWCKHNVGLISAIGQPWPGRGVKTRGKRMCDEQTASCQQTGGHMMMKSQYNICVTISVYVPYQARYFIQVCPLSVTGAILPAFQPTLIHLGAVKLLLVQPLIHLIVQLTHPPGKAHPVSGVGRVAS